MAEDINQDNMNENIVELEADWDAYQREQQARFWLQYVEESEYWL